MTAEIIMKKLYIKVLNNSSTDSPFTRFKLLSTKSAQTLCNLFYNLSYVGAIRGNHCVATALSLTTVDLNLQTIECFGLTLGGFAGSWQYKRVGNHMYTQ